MQQILVVLLSGADGGAISGSIDNNSGSFHAFVAPTVLLVDGDQTVQDALNQTAGVVATLSDEDAKAAVAATDITQLDIAEMATLLGNILGTNASFEESVVLAISGWMYGLSQEYATKKSDRPRDGEIWDMDGGCLPTDELFANS